MKSVLVNSTSSMPVQLMKLTRSVSVTVRPTVLNLRPTGSSSHGKPIPTVSILSVGILLPVARHCDTRCDQLVDVGRAESRFLQNRAGMIAVLRRRRRRALLAVRDEDRAVHGFDVAEPGIIAIHDRAAIAHLWILHRFLERRQLRPRS